MVPEIWSATDKIFCHFGLFFALLTPTLTTQKIKNLKKWKNTCWYYHFTHVYHKWQSHDVYFLRYGPWLTDRTFCHFGPLALLHKCNKNHDHMLYCSSDMVRNRCNCYFSFWTIFCLFTSLTAQKNKMKKKKKRKKDLEISLFYNSVSKIMIICYTVPEIWCVTDVIAIFHFGFFFAF